MEIQALLKRVASGEVSISFKSKAIHDVTSGTELIHIDRIVGIWVHSNAKRSSGWTICWSPFREVLEERYQAYLRGIIEGDDNVLI